MSPAQRGVVLAGFCAFVGFYATQPLLPLLASIFHAGKVAVSMTITASTIGVAIAAPIAGRVADRLGRRRVIVIAALLSAFCNFLAATSSGLNELILWRFIQGLITPGVFAITVAYVNDEWTDGQRGRTMGYYVTGTVIGGFSGRMISGTTAAHFNWRWALIALGTVNLIAAIAVWAWLPRERHFRRTAKSASPFHAILDHLKNRQLLATYAVGFCVMFSLVSTFTYITFHLAAPPFNLGAAALGSIFFVYLVGAVVTPVCTRYIDRFGYRNAVAAAVAMGITGMLLTMGSRLWIVLLGLCICCSGVFISQASASSNIGTAATHNRALAVGLYVTFYYLGGSAGASFPGWLWNAGGWTACIALVIAVQIATVIIALTEWNNPAQICVPEVPVP